MNFFEKSRWAKLLKGCRYNFVAEKIGNAFNGTLIPKQLSILLDAYCSNPCLENAVKLIKYDIENNKVNIEEANFLTLFMSASDMAREEFYNYFKNRIFSPEEIKESGNDEIKTAD